MKTIVMTGGSSGFGASLATPRHANAALLAHPDQDPDRHRQAKEAGEHAYTASKLCAVLTACTLHAHPETHKRGIAVIAYDPGQVFGTGLARNLASAAAHRMDRVRHTARSAAAQVQSGNQHPRGSGTRPGRSGARHRRAAGRSDVCRPPPRPVHLAGPVSTCAQRRRSPGAAGRPRPTPRAGGLTAPRTLTSPGENPVN